MSSITLKSIAVISLIAASVPAFASPSASQEKTVMRYDAKTQKYCITEAAMTGTRLNKKTCQTAAQWSAAGLDMPKPLTLAQE